MNGEEDIKKQAAALFAEQQQHIFKRTDRLFAGLMLFEWLAGIAAAFILSPKTWRGPESEIHINIWASIFLGAAIISLPIYLALKRPGKTYTRHAIAVGQMMTSALLIHISGGRIETHFHVFGSLAFLAFYRDWKVLISASSVVAADHLLRGVFWPESVFGVLTASNWRWVEHAVWVVFEDIFLIKSCLQGVKDMQAAAYREARLESTKEIIESAIAERTAALRASEERFRSLSASSPIGIFQSDTQGRCVYTNERWYEISGLSAEESLGEGWNRAIHAEDREAMFAEWATCIGEGRPFSYEFRFLTPKGETHWGHSRMSELLADGGEVTGYVGTIEDITERKRSEAALKKSEEKFRTLLESASESIVTVDGRGIITLVNARAEEVFGYRREEMLGQPMEMLMPERFRSNHSSHRGGYLSAPRTRPMGKGMELYGLRKNGSEFPIEISLSYVKNEDGITVMSFITDITERKLGERTMRESKEAAEAATRAKSEFLANMSHEIRTPMNAVIGMTGLLLDTQLNEEQRDFIETIRSSGDALLTIINDILDFSKIESGHLELEQHPFDLRDCLEESLDLITTRASEKGIDLAYLVDTNVPGSIMGDSTRLRQILANLLSNAIKFTEEGEITVSVTARPLEENGRMGVWGYGSMGEGKRQSDSFASPTLPHSHTPILGYELHFTVEDTGIGIPADKMDRLFRSFSQVDASTTRTYGGTGLGLAISKRLAELMGGRMWVESEVGRGSKFHFTIAALPAPSQARVFLRTTQPKLNGRQVLIVDDNATNRRILSMQAESWGMKAITTSSGREALDMLSLNQSFDLAILDMQMPEMDGLQLATEIRRRYDRFPMVMLTSLGQRPAELNGGLFAAFLNKPIKPSQLYDALIDIFDGRHKVPGKAPAPKQQFVRISDRLPLRILLAEDNAVNQKVAIRILERLGYRVDVVANGIEAIEAVSRQTYDVILMDVQMPEMDGLEASRRIARRWAKGVRPRIIAMTANAMQGDREDCLDAGMDDYISKPVKVEELVAALERCGYEAGTRDFESVNEV